MSPGRLLALKLLRHHSIVKFRFDRDWREDVAAHEMINEMLGLAVFPLLRVEGERLLAERIGIALAEPGKFHLGQGAQARRRNRGPPEYGSSDLRTGAKAGSELTWIEGRILETGS